MPSSPADSSTQSAWGVPVLHPVSTDPCYDSAKGKASQCDKPEGWRWNLDFVVSPNGFVQRYGYTPETNHYDLGGGQAATGDSGTLTSYTRGGTLTKISTATHWPTSRPDTRRRARSTSRRPSAARPPARSPTARRPT